MPNFNLRKLFLYLLIASVAACAVIGIAVILFGNFGDFETRVLLTAVTITVTSILGLICGACVETGGNRIIPFAGIIFTVLSGVMWLVLIWSEPIGNDLFVKSLMTATVLGASCSHISLLSMARLDKRFIWSRYAAHGSIWSLTAYLIFLIWNPNSVDEDVTGRILGVLGIIVATITIITPILHKLSSRELSLAGIDSEIDQLKERIAELESKRSEFMPANETEPIKRI